MLQSTCLNKNWLDIEFAVHSSNFIMMKIIYYILSCGLGNVPTSCYLATTSYRHITDYQICMYLYLWKQFISWISQIKLYSQFQMRSPSSSQRGKNKKWLDISEDTHPNGSSSLNSVKIVIYIVRADTHVENFSIRCFGHNFLCLVPLCTWEGKPTCFRSYIYFSQNIAKLRLLKFRLRYDMALNFLYWIDE